MIKVKYTNPIAYIPTQAQAEVTNYKHFYTLAFDGPNTYCGTHRADNLKNINAQNKIDVMNLTRALLNVKVASFTDALIKLSEYGIRVFEYTNCDPKPINEDAWWLMEMHNVSASEAKRYGWVA